MKKRIVLAAINIALIFTITWGSFEPLDLPISIKNSTAVINHFLSFTFKKTKKYTLCYALVMLNNFQRAIVRININKSRKAWTSLSSPINQIPQFIGSLGKEIGLVTHVAPWFTSKQAHVYIFRKKHEMAIWEQLSIPLSQESQIITAFVGTSPSYWWARLQDNSIIAMKEKHESKRNIIQQYRYNA